MVAKVERDSDVLNIVPLLLGQLLCIHGYI